MLYQILGFVKDYWALILLSLVALRLIRNRYKTSLYDIPGPFFASLSDLWLLWHCYRGRCYKDYELHREYGSPVLRLGPNTVSVSDPNAVKIIYGWKRVFNKVHDIQITSAIQSPPFCLHLTIL